MTTNGIPDPEATKPPLPMFFHRVAMLDPAAHADLRLNRAGRFGFVANSNSVPLCFEEIIVAADYFPIVFSQAGLTPLAVMGCRDGENVFVNAAGQWMAGVYIPAYLRAWPFIAAGAGENSERTFIAMEADSPQLSKDSGVALFEDGKPSPILREIIALCNFYRNSLPETRKFAQALEAAGLLHERGANLKFQNGDTMQLRGFKALDAEKLEALNNETIIDFRTHRWLAPLFAIQRSAARWSRLIDAAGARRLVDSVAAGLHEPTLGV